MTTIRTRNTRVAVLASSRPISYIARAEGTLFPAAETQGLLYLRPDEVRTVARDRPTLGAFLGQGGAAQLRDPLPGHLPLETLTKLRVLAILLNFHPELFRV